MGGENVHRNVGANAVSGAECGQGGEAGVAGDGGFAVAPDDGGAPGRNGAAGGGAYISGGGGTVLIHRQSPPGTFLYEVGKLIFLVQIDGLVGGVGDLQAFHVVIGSAVSGAAVDVIGAYLSDVHSLSGISGNPGLAVQTPDLGGIDLTGGGNVHLS